jgi:hypothetical protein
MEHTLGPSETGGAVLNIGGDVGAAVVRTPALLLGSEIEIRRVGAAWESVHTAVRERVLPDGPIYAALFDSLVSGRYDLRVRHGDAGGPVAVVDVEGGRSPRRSSNLAPMGNPQSASRCSTEGTGWAKIRARPARAAGWPIGHIVARLPRHRCQVTPAEEWSEAAADRCTGRWAARSCCRGSARARWRTSRSSGSMRTSE